MFEGGHYEMWKMRDKSQEMLLEENINSAVIEWTGYKRACEGIK